MSNRSSFSMVRLLLAGFLLLATAFMPVSLQAQGTSATVSGVVTDSTGAKIPAATVTFTNASTGAVANATTNGEGLYRLNGLLPGLYNAAVTMQGFKTALQQSIDLHLEDQVSLDYVLEVGASSESVTINADANILETQSPTLSQVIEGRQVEDTPLNGRNTMNLVALTPGVVSQGGTSGAASNNTSGGAFTNANSFGNYSIAGGLAAQGTIYVDGAPINTVEGMAVAFVITQDAVQEFRVESSVVNPQYGGFGGGVVSFGTKSGGNRMHGTLYEYFRNTIFNANTLFNNLYNIQRPKFNQNQFGATIGGPILKDKAFYFASYEGYRLAQGVINSGRVPTPAELNGDFTADSKIINPVPTLGPMVAPGVYAYASYNQVQCGGVLNKFCIGAPVNPGDAVADPTSQYLANTLHYFPLPNATGHGAAVNFLQNGKANARTAQETMRVDYNLNPRNKLFARVTRFDRTQDPTQFFNNPIGPQSFTGVGATASQYVIGDTATLNPTSVFDVRLSYLRYFSYLQPANTSVPLGPLDNGDQAGFWSAAAHQISPYFPGIIITNNTTFPYTGLGQAAQQPLNLYTIFATYSKVLGRHSLAAGGEVRQGEEYFFNQPFLAGSFAFAGTQTACTPSGAGTVTFNDAAHTALNKYCGAPGGAPTNLVIPGSGATPVADFVSGQFAASPTGFTTTDHPSAVNHYVGVETETGRRAVEENISAIREAGLFKIMVPRRFGGLETDIRTKMEVSAALAKGCGSTAWVTTLMNVCAYFAGLSSAECQNDIWGTNPEARIAGVFAPLATTKRVDGGLIVTGKWPWSSGSLHSDWAMMGIPVVNEAGEPIDQGMAFMPMSQCTIEDTWFVAGMKGTGSNTIVAKDVFVPDHRIMSVSQLMQGNTSTPYKDEVLYRCAFIPVAALILAGPMMGLCKRALEFVIEKAPKRSISYTFYKTQVESPSFQLSIAKAAMLVDTVWLHALRAADDIWAAAAANRFPSYTERARVRMDTGYAASTARDAMDILLSAHGASSFAEVSPLQRMWRDLETCSRHAVVSPEISSEVYGKALLGIEGGVTALV